MNDKQLDFTTKAAQKLLDIQQLLREVEESFEPLLEADWQKERGDRWWKCATMLYDELRVRGVSESVSRDGAGCIELFEAMDAEEYA
jgi:hypothetical protein